MKVRQSYSYESLENHFYQMSDADKQMLIDLAKSCAEEEMARKPRLRLICRPDPAGDARLLCASS